MTMTVVALFGGLGAGLRFAVDTAVKSRVRSSFPWGTLLINVTGSFTLALLVGLAGSEVVSPALYAVAGVGFCGGYTTFSTASVETVRLIQSGRISAAAAYAFGGLLATLVASGCGMAVASIG